MSELTTKTTEIDDTKVKIEVEVPSEELSERLDRSAKVMAKEMKLPGFRKGKVPPNLVVQKLGREALMEQAIRDGLGEWCQRAILSSSIKPIGGPKVDLGELPSNGGPLGFTIEIGVRPKAKLGKYKGLEVGCRSEDVPSEVVAQEIEKLRESAAKLETVERPLKEGDFAVIDFDGRIGGKDLEGGQARDYSIEIGSGSLIPGFEEQLIGLSAEQNRTIKVTFPEDYQSEQAAGKEAEFDITLKAVQEKKLPELNDDLALEVSEFDTLDELKADITEKLSTAQRQTIEDEFRTAVIDAVAGKATVDLTDELIGEKAHDMWHVMEGRLQRQGINPANYLHMTGKDHDQMVEELKPEAMQTIKREAVLDAIAEKEEIAVEESELIEALSSEGELKVEDRGRLLDHLKKSGQYDSIAEQLLYRKVTDFLIENAKAIRLEKAEAREAIWTPDKEEDESSQSDKKLWAP